MKQGSFAPAGLCCPDRRHYYDPLRLPLGRLPLPGITGYRQGCYPPPQDGAEEDLSSSKDNPVTIPRPLRREVPRHRLQDQRCRPWPSPFRNRLGSSLSARRRTARNDAAGFTSCCGLVTCSAPLRTPPLDDARGPHYRGPWRLPGPDSHRLAALSLSLSYVTTTSLSSWRPSCWTHSGLAGSPSITASPSTTSSNRASWICHLVASLTRNARRRRSAARSRCFPRLIRPGADMASNRKLASRSRLRHAHPAAATQPIVAVG